MDALHFTEQKSPFLSDCSEVNYLEMVEFPKFSAMLNYQDPGPGDVGILWREKSLHLDAGEG